MKQRCVIYTVIFGKRDVVLEPSYKPNNCDFVCFTDQHFKSATWEIRNIAPLLPEDSRRSARYVKVMAHRMLPEYETSIFIDGNVIVTGDVTKLVETYLDGANLAGFDHAVYTRFPLKTVAEQASILMTPRQCARNGESAEIIQEQMNAYVQEGFPDDNGIMWTMTLVRRHNEPDVVEAMEAWWRELSTRSKRDQMSFNYVAWKHSFKFNYIPLDGGNNEYVFRKGHHISFWKKNRIRFFVLLKRLQHMIATTTSKDVT